MQQVQRYAKGRYRSWDQRWLDRREQNLVDGIFREHHLSGTILDIPAGYGRFQRLLTSFGPVVAADLGFFPLLYEKKNLGIAPGSVNCAAENLPFSDSSVDLVFCFRLMQHLHEEGERIAVLKEFRRISRRWIVVSAYLSSTLHKLHRAILPQPSRITMLSRPKFESELSEAGLIILKMVSVMPGLHAHRIYLLSTGKSA